MYENVSEMLRIANLGKNEIETEYAKELDKNAQLVT